MRQILLNVEAGFHESWEILSNDALLGNTEKERRWMKAKTHALAKKLVRGSKTKSSEIAG
jgi:hypothetical protein